MPRRAKSCGASGWAASSALRRSWPTVKSISAARTATPRSSKPRESISSWQRINSTTASWPAPPSPARRLSCGRGRPSIVLRSSRMAEGTGNRGQGSDQKSQFASRDKTWSRFFRCRRWLVLFLQYSVLSTQYLAAAGDGAYSTKLAALSTKCDELALKEQAETTRGWLIQRYPRRQYLFLPATSDSTEPKASAPEAARQWHKRCMDLRRQP